MSKTSPIGPSVQHQMSVIGQGQYSPTNYPLPNVTGLCNQSKPCREPEMQTVFNDLTNEISRQDEIVSNLVSRLGMLVRPSCPDKDCKNEVESGYQAEWPNRIKAMLNKIQSNNNTIADLIDRLEA